MNRLPDTAVNLLICPLDGQALQKRDNSLVCLNDHSFDIAKRGYVNLLPVQHKRSKYPGDSKEMVLARKLFLDLEHYKAISATVCELSLPLLHATTLPLVLDAGCGEGYYLHALYSALNKPLSPFVGLDISKEAIDEACKRNRNITWIVGSNRLPPVIDSSVDLTLCMFGFPEFAAFKKITKPNGWVLLVDPGTEHLRELKALIYDDVKPPSEGNSKNALFENEGFQLRKHANLHYQTPELDNNAINNLLKMTPHFYRATKEKRELASKLQSLSLTVDVNFTLIQLSG